MKQVLVVEDQADLRQMLVLTLSLEPYQVHEAPDGAEGWRLAQALRPDLILMDVVMPGALDGLQVCALVRAEPALAHTRVVLLSGRAQAQDRADGLNAGADAYLSKPFSPLELLDTLERLLPAD